MRRARRHREPEQVVQACRARGAKVEPALVDMRDSDAIAAWIAEIWALGPVDLLVVNAGIFGGRASPEAMEQARVSIRVIETNLTGAFLCASAMAGRMRVQGGGHIALISSLAAFTPGADAPSYGASKAGLTAFGRALCEDMARHGVAVTLVHPGHIHSHQARQQNGPAPLIMSPEAAARRIMRGLEAGRGAISFPVGANIWVRAIRLLPWRLQARINRLQRFVVDNDSADQPEDQSGGRSGGGA